MTDIHDWLQKTEPFLEADFICFGQHVTGPIRTGRQPEYSEQLRDLVRECLKPAIAKRPTVTQLVTRTRVGMERYRTTSRTGRDTTRPPALTHLKRSQSVLGRLPAARPRQPDLGAATSQPTAKPSTPNWEPRQDVKRQRTQSYVVPPITISSDDDEEAIPPAPLPPAADDEREGKRRYYHASDTPLPAKREIITNIAGDVIVISDSTSAAEEKGAGDVIVISDSTPAAEEKEAGHLTALEAFFNEVEADGARIGGNKGTELRGDEEEAEAYNRSSFFDQLLP
jgi:hypothetical protein